MCKSVQTAEIRAVSSPARNPPSQGWKIGVAVERRQGKKRPTPNFQRKRQIGDVRLNGGGGVSLLLIGGLRGFTRERQLRAPITSRFRDAPPAAQDYTQNARLPS